MPEDLLRRIENELRERVEASRAARAEYERLERALAALDVAEGRDVAPPPAKTAGRRRSPGPGAPRRRAPRGQNRERVVSAVQARPGATAADIARASGVGRAVVYNLLSRLVASGELEKEALPGGGTGYALSDGGRAGDVGR